MNFMSINEVILKEMLKYAYKVLFGYLNQGYKINFIVKLKKHELLYMLHILKKNNNNERFLEISECYLKILYCLSFVSFLL